MVRAISASRENKTDGFYKTVTIPNASVLTLNSVGYTLLSAPTNTAKVICMVAVFAAISAGTAYASVHDMTIAYGTPLSQGVVIATIPGTGFLDQTAATGVWASFPGTSSKGSIVTASSGAVSILCGTGDPTTGTSPLSIRMKYVIHTVA